MEQLMNIYWNFTALVVSLTKQNLESLCRRKSFFDNFMLGCEEQYVFHFRFPQDSIDVRKITTDELQWCKNELDIYRKIVKDLPMFNQYYRTENIRVIEKMFEKWFPEYLL